MTKVVRYLGTALPICFLTCEYPPVRNTRNTPLKLEVLLFLSLKSHSNMSNISLLRSLISPRATGIAVSSGH